VLYVVDLSGYVFRAYHALPPLSSSRGEPTHAVLGTVNMLQKIAKERRPRLFAVAMDSQGPTFRFDLDPRYKATRPPPPPDLSQQMERVKQIIRAWNVACFCQAGLEADDLIAAATVRAREAGWRVVLVSADKDLMQLVHDDDDDVLLWDSMRERVYASGEVKAKLGVPPSRVRDFLALTGDSSDNVPGVPGVGPKTAADLLAQFGSLDGIYEGIDRISRPKLRESLREHQEDARMSLRLVTLDVGATLEWRLDRLSWGGADIQELRRLYGDLEFGRQLELLESLAKTEPGGAKTGNDPAMHEGASTTEPQVTPQPPAIVLEASVLQRLVSDATATGSIGLSVEATAADATRASIVGLSIASGHGRSSYVPIAHRYLGCPRQIPWDVVRSILLPALSDARVTKVGHDLKRIGVLFERAGLRIDGARFDVQLAAYLVDPEAPNGAGDLVRRELGTRLSLFEEASTKGRGPPPSFDEIDVERAAGLTAPLAEYVLALRSRIEPRLSAEGLDRLMRDVEMPLGRVLADMEMRGVLVDLGALEALGKEAERLMTDLEADCKRLVGRDFSVRSRDQLEKILFDELKLPNIKRTPKGGRSTDADVLEALAEQHALPKRILEFRELDKLKGTYIDALPRYLDPKTGRIHTRFDQAVAATGRLSSSDPNLQNIPIRTELGKKIRGAFVAPPGSVILSADYSQIELRVLAHLANDAQLIEAFSTGEDVHVRTAALIFGKTPASVSADERRAAKTINFGVIYGMGEGALAKQIGVSRDQAAQFIAAYFAKYDGVARFMERTVEQARQGEAVRTLLGRRRFLPNLHSANRALRLEAERVARNTPIQGTAADLLKLAMIEIDRAQISGEARMVLTVHDELVFEVAEGVAPRAAAEIREQMQSVMKLAVPLVVDVGWGKSWAEAH
jgi:DNA polymerase-1